MAFLANDPNKETDQNKVSMNTEGGQEQPASQDSSQPNSGGGSGAGGVIQANSAQGSQAPTQAHAKRPSKGGKGSSGMFTNIRKYMDANKPAAGKMASAAGKGSQKAAGSISQQVGQQKGQLKAQLDKNKADRANASTFAQGQITAAMGGAAPKEPVVAAPPASDGVQTAETAEPVVAAPPASTPNIQLDQANVDRFRNLATGRESFNDVQKMNLAKQQIAAKRLEQQGKTAGTEAGRRELLKSTFGKSGREYNRGQQGLDALIVGGDVEARTQLVDQTQGAAKAAQEGIQSAQTYQEESLQAQDIANRDFAQGLQDQTTGAADKFVADADAAYDAATGMRKTQAAALEKQKQDYADRMTSLQNRLSMTGDSETAIANRNRFLKDLGFEYKNDWAQERNSTYSGWGDKLDADGNKIAGSRQQAAMDFVRTGDSKYIQNFKHHRGGQHLDPLIRRSILGEMSGNVADTDLLGINSDMYGGSFDAEYNTNRSNDLITGNKGNKWLDAIRTYNEIQGLANQAGNYDSEAMMQAELNKIQEGMTLDQFREGSDISRENITSAEDIARYQALSQLSGGTGSELMAENKAAQGTSGDYLDETQVAEYLATLGKK